MCAINDNDSVGFTTVTLNIKHLPVNIVCLHICIIRWVSHGYDRASFVSDVTTVGTIVTTELVKVTKCVTSLCVSCLLQFDSASGAQSGKSLLQSVSQRLYLT